MSGHFASLLFRTQPDISLNMHFRRTPCSGAHIVPNTASAVTKAGQDTAEGNQFPMNLNRFHRMIVTVHLQRKRKWT